MFGTPFFYVATHIVQQKAIFVHVFDKNNIEKVKNVCYNKNVSWIFVSKFLTSKGENHELL